MTSQKQYKLMQARQAFERQVGYVRAELKTCTRTEHLQPVLEFLEWLVRDMADLAGVTAEVTSCAKEQAAIRAQVASRALQLAVAPKPRRGKPAPPKLQLLQGGRK